MKLKTLHIITGLPRSGGTMIASLLNQNPALYSDANSELPGIMNLLHQTWQNVNTIDTDTRLAVMQGIVAGYFNRHTPDTVFSRNLYWTPLIPVIEEVLQREVKILVCVRNPAEILSSFERSRAENPLILSDADRKLRETSNLPARCFFYAGPDGILGITHRHIQDAVVMGYLDRMLFVDYGAFCSTPRSQIQRIYDFFEIPKFDHDFNNIQSQIPFVRSRLEKVTVNSVQYLGLDLFEQYNSHTFWNAWV